MQTNHKDFPKRPAALPVPNKALWRPRDAMQVADYEALLLRQGQRGMTLLSRSGNFIHVPAHPVKVRDESGAADTAAAVLAEALTAGADWETAWGMANAAATVAVSKKGTAP